MLYKTTKELEEIVIDLYDKITPMAKKDDIYIPLNVIFGDNLPQNYEGTYCNSDKRGYHYCFTERGEVIINNLTDSLFEITYWILKEHIAFMASKYKSQHKVSGQDFRRIMFSKETELFQEIGENYKKRAEIEIDEILKEVPFQDHLF